MPKKKKRSTARVLKKATRKIISPIKKEKRIRRDLLFITIYTVILLLTIFILEPRIQNDLDLSFSRSMIITFLVISVLFFFYYYITKKKDWRKIEVPPAWVLKKRKSLGDDFSGYILVEGKTYQYLIIKKADKTTYYEKDKNKD